MARAEITVTVADLPEVKAVVDRLRAENAALAAALEDIAGIWETERGYDMTGECSSMGPICHHRYPDDPGEWCPVCVAEVAWCAWKMGVLG